MTRRVAIYARFSSDMQDVKSARDQIALCREFADEKGWDIRDIFQDEAISGAKRNRPAYQKMLEAVRHGLVDIVLAEGLDRLNRSQELSANLYSICEYNRVEIHTLNDGRIEEIHIGMKGTMDALQLKRISQETHRGQLGTVKVGKSAGGISFGYRIPVDPSTGLRQTGELVIDDTQAHIVQRIFQEFADGTSPKAIAYRLNMEGVPSPRGGCWKVNTIYGNTTKGTGILNNELYIGLRVWNRLQYRKNPETDRRTARHRSEDEIERVEVPALRIVDQSLWEKVKARQAAQRKTLKTAAPCSLRRKKYLLSGLVRCGICGGTMTVAGADNRRAYYCANAKEKGPTVCTGQPGLRLDRLEPLVLSALRTELMTPPALEQFRMELAARLEEANQDRRDTVIALQRSLAREQKAIDGCLRAIREDHATASIYAMLEAAEDAKAQIEADLASWESSDAEISVDIAEL